MQLAGGFVIIPKTKSKNTVAKTRLETDYLIVGSGAVGMAFADTLLDETDHNIIMVDLHHKPGGHWNVAYPFVTLHQPSAYYGVNSRELSNGKLDEIGLNKGLSHLASGAEVLAYFDAVMKEKFLPSGRVQFFPKCEYEGSGQFRSTLSGNEFEVTVRQKTVDATYLKTNVPSRHTPSFSIGENVRFMPVNDLPKVKDQPDGFVIIGGGKTGIDACLWLLEQGVDPDNIRLIMPRDGWMLDRANTQADPDFFHQSLGTVAAQFEAIAQAGSVDDLFERLEAAGVLIRLDPAIKPKMFHGATISRAELKELQRIKNVIRMGRVSNISENEITLDEGSIKTTPNTVHVDCSASAITNTNIRPVFEGKLITPQTVRSYQPVFSAAFIAHIEATRDNEAEKNQLCTVVPLPNHDTDWIRLMIPFMMNQYQWSRDPELRNWLENSRLDGFSAMARNVDKNDDAKQAVLKKMRDYSMPAMANLHKLVAQLDNKK